MTFQCTQLLLVLQVFQTRYNVSAYSVFLFKNFSHRATKSFYLRKVQTSAKGGFNLSSDICLRLKRVPRHGTESHATVRHFVIYQISFRSVFLIKVAISRLLFYRQSQTLVCSLDLPFLQLDLGFSQPLRAPPPLGPKLAKTIIASRLQYLL